MAELTHWFILLFFIILHTQLITKHCVFVQKLQKRNIQNTFQWLFQSNMMVQFCQMNLKANVKELQQGRLIDQIMESQDTKQVTISKHFSVSPKAVALSLKIQARAGLALARWTKLAGKSRNRYYRLRELATTEGDYHDDLIIIRDHIKLPLRQSGLITQDQEKTIFANIEAMIGLSAQLKEQLDGKLKGWNRHKTLLGETMKKYAKFLLFYSDYFKNLNSSQIFLNHLLKTSPVAKQIQQKLSTQSRIVTIEDMMSKPFQRPLKYHLILRDYTSKIPDNHPDTNHLKEAIQCYHQVNEQNNESLQNGEKDKIMINLDSKFGNIIKEGEGSRSYIDHFESILIDMSVDLYLFSDMLLIVIKEKNTQIRIHLDRWSYTQRPSDGHFFLNRLYVYGRTHCVHLSFLQRQHCIIFAQTINKVISGIKYNDFTRQQKIGSEMQRYTRRTFIQKRQSYTQLKPQVKRPIIITVIGNDQRRFKEDSEQHYYVLQFKQTPAKLDNITPPHQLALVNINTLFKIETMIKTLYPDLLFFSITHCPKNVTTSKMDHNPDMRREFRTIFIQLMLNTIFRDNHISKRLQIYAHLLGVSDVMWEHVNVPNMCAINQCKACADKPKYDTYEEYYQEERKRYFAKSEASSKRIIKSSDRKVHFCDRKTVKMGLALQPVKVDRMQSQPLEARLQWIKRKLGFINHVFTHPRPASTRMSKKIHFCNVVHPNEGVDIEFNINQKVRHLKSLISERIRANLEDYTLVALIGDSPCVLAEDQSIGSILARPQEEEGFFTFFKKQPYRISIWLRKIYFFESTLEAACQQRKLHLKTQELIYRIKNEEIKLKDLKHYSEVYAWYYCFKHFIELDTLSYYLIKKRTEQLDRMLPENMRMKIIDTLYFEIQKIKHDKSIKHQNKLAQKIIYSVLENPSGGFYCYQAQLRPDFIKIMIGCDYQGIKVRGQSSLLFDFKFSSKSLSLALNGYQLIISEDKDYVFYSTDMWRLKQQIDLHWKYYKEFYESK